MKNGVPRQYTGGAAAASLGLLLRAAASMGWICQILPLA
jgi:hypothetical protein